MIDSKKKYWSGVNPEIEDVLKLKIRSLLEKTDRDKRLMIEADYIIKVKLISQDMTNDKFNSYTNIEYCRLNFWIYPWHSQREEAFKYHIKSLQNSSE